MLFQLDISNIEMPVATAGLNAPPESSCRSLPPGRRRMWVGQFVFQRARRFGTRGWQRCWRRLRVSVLGASECDGTGQEEGAINNSPTERGFCRDAYASQPLY